MGFLGHWHVPAAFCPQPRQNPKIPVASTSVDFGQLIFSPLALALMNEDPQLAPMKQTRHEQALFRLPPLAPDPQQLNQILARLLLRERFFDWLFISGLFMSCAALFGMSGEVLLAQLAACHCVKMSTIFSRSITMQAIIAPPPRNTGWQNQEFRAVWAQVRSGPCPAPIE